MSLLLKGLINRREMARDIGRALAIGALAAVASIGLSAGAVEGQVGGGREVQRVEQQLSVVLPQVIILRDQRVVAEQEVNGMREVVIALRVGGNVPMRLEVAPLGAEAAAGQVQNAAGQWMELDRVVVVGQLELGALRDQQIKVRIPSGQEVPVVRAVRAN